MPGPAAARPAPLPTRKGRMRQGKYCDSSWLTRSLPDLALLARCLDSSNRTGAGSITCGICPSSYGSRVSLWLRAAVPQPGARHTRKFRLPGNTTRWRLAMQDDDLRPSDNIDDRRGQGGGGINLGRGGLGIGTIIILGLIGWALGINPAILINGAQMIAGGGDTASVSQPRSGPSGTP